MDMRHPRILPQDLVVKLGFWFGDSMPVMLMLICSSGCSFLKLTTESFQGISSDPYKFLGIGG